MKKLLFLLILGCVSFAKAQDTIQYTPYELLSSYYDDGSFKPFAKKNWFVGAAFSVEDKTQENTSNFLSTVISGKSSAYDFTLKGGTTLLYRHQLKLRLKLVYSQGVLKQLGFCV